MALYNQLSTSIRLGQDKQGELNRAIKSGVAFYNKFNESRMELAFSNFDLDMKKALYEVLFFLHVNDPRFENHSFSSTEIQRVDGRLKEVEVTKTATLYLEDCPAGVMGMDALSTQFRSDFHEYVKSELQAEVPVIEGYCPFYSVSSLGSIGTIGHKQTASDLDLQVQYEFQPFITEPEKLDDQHLRDYAKSMIRYFGRLFARKKKYSKAQLQSKEARQLMITYGKAQLKKRFPLVYKILILKAGGKVTATEKIALIHEIIRLSEMYQKYCLKFEQAAQDQKLKLRIGRIQTYVQEKYPKAEIYLFAYSANNYRDGDHGTTLESKEASGSAYELILNYDTLMPGIQFSPVIPIHFLMPANVNANRGQYERLVEYLKYQFIDLYDKYKDNLVDLGSTPPLTREYMVAHSGAIYWESFKASSGNLPKAFLNLLRLEMLFDPRFNVSIIELIKQPNRLDQYMPADEEADSSGDESQELEDDFFADYGLESTEDVDNTAILSEADFAGGLTIKDILKAEDRFKRLLEDPWWLRYKALKIGFSTACKTIEDPETLDRISSIIDLGFCLHIRISDVFAPPKKKPEPTYREKVLRYLLLHAFPLSKKVHLEHIFMGEVEAVRSFETELKGLFRASMARILLMVSDSKGQDQSNQDEFKIWYHYYEKFFEPKPNVVRPDILAHLKVARDRLKIGIDVKGGDWTFRSIQRKDDQDDKFSAEALEHLPSEVTLYRHPRFLHGVTHCVMNGYFGTFNKGTLFERETHLELEAARLDLGKRSANTYCFVTPDTLDRLVHTLIDSFPPQEYDYRDCINKERVVTEVLVCLNLLEFGRLSILYRDNLKVWYVDEFDHPAIESGADQFNETVDLLFGHAELVQTLKQFMQEQKINFSQFPKEKFLCWVNPASARTSHPATKRKLKEQDLAAAFKKSLLKLLK